MEFTDEYNHSVPGVMYFARSFPCKEVEESYEYSLEGCNCETECSVDNKCTCVERSGSSYKYNNIYNIQSYTISENDSKKPTYECNDNCSCRQRVCGNRVVQFGPRKNLDIKFCEGKGLGLFTVNKIKKGNFVCEYAGEIISENEACQRFKRNTEQKKMNYIFCIKEQFGERTVKTFIDPTHFGNVGRYINHSCEPNCKLFVIRINDTIPTLGIFAMEDIKENSEITYDYGEEEVDNENPTETTRKICLCNSKKCRKYLPFDVSLS